MKRRKQYSRTILTPFYWKVIWYSGPLETHLTLIMYVITTSLPHICEMDKRTQECHSQSCLILDAYDNIITSVSSTWVMLVNWLKITTPGSWLPIGARQWSAQGSLYASADTCLYKFLMLTLKVLNFWKFTSYCSLKHLWLGMGEVPRRPYIPHPLPLCINCCD